MSYAFGHAFRESLNGDDTFAPAKHQRVVVRSGGEPKPSPKRAPPVRPGALPEGLPPGQLHLRSPYAGAVVWIDGRPVGTVPMIWESGSPGEVCEVEYRMPGFAPVGFKIIFPYPGEIVDCMRTLDPNEPLQEKRSLAQLSGDEAIREALHRMFQKAEVPVERQIEMLDKVKREAGGVPQVEILLLFNLYDYLVSESLQNSSEADQWEVAEGSAVEDSYTFTSAYSEDMVSRGTQTSLILDEEYPYMDLAALDEETSPTYGTQADVNSSRLSTMTRDVGSMIATSEAASPSYRKQVTTMESPRRGKKKKGQKKQRSTRKEQRYTGVLQPGAAPTWSPPSAPNLVPFSAGRVSPPPYPPLPPLAPYQLSPTYSSSTDSPAQYLAPLGDPLLPVHATMPAAAVFPPGSPSPHLSSLGQLAGLPLDPPMVAPHFPSHVSPNISPPTPDVPPPQAAWQALPSPPFAGAQTWFLEPTAAVPLRSSRASSPGLWAASQPPALEAADPFAPRQPSPELRVGLLPPSAPLGLSPVYYGLAPNSTLPSPMLASASPVAFPTPMPMLPPGWSQMLGANASGGPSCCAPEPPRPYPIVDYSQLQAFRTCQACVPRYVTFVPQQAFAEFPMFQTYTVYQPISYITSWTSRCASCF